MARVIGIDLGTTNSVVACVDDGRPVIIESEEGERVVPSYVAVRQTGGTYVGTTARRDSIEDPGSVVYAVKRLMGRAFDSLEVAKVAETVSYQIVRGPNQEAMVRIGDLTLSPVDVSAHILTYLRELASDRLGTPVTEAVITVPAHFNDRQRKATKEAGERAGLTVLRLINEPTSAALAFGFGKNVDKRVAVYDLGGGTFDISILDVAEGVYEVLATAGDTFLGGVDFDNRLVSYLIREHIMKNTQSVIDKVSMLRLRAAAEAAKIELSSKTSTEVSIRSFLGMEEFVASITRSELEQIAKDLVRRTIDVCERTLNDAKLKPGDIEEVILVGGQTRMPAVRAAVEEFFGQIPHTEINPDEAVALGAALHAQSLSTGDDSTLLLDVTPLTLGIASYGDNFAPILEKNSKVPCSITRTFSTVRDNQESVKIVVLQGEHANASQNVLLGEFTLTGIEEAPRLTPKIDVTFRLDANGILQVAAQDQKTGESKQIMIKGFIEGGEPAGTQGMVSDAQAPAVKDAG